MWPMQFDKRERGVTRVRESRVQRDARELDRQRHLRKPMSTLADA